MLPGNGDRVLNPHRRFFCQLSIMTLQEKCCLSLRHSRIGSKLRPQVFTRRVKRHQRSKRRRILLWRDQECLKSWIFTQESAFVLHARHFLHRMRSPPQVTPQVERLVSVFSGVRQRQELQDLLGPSDRKNFRLNNLNPAIEAGLVGLLAPIVLPAASSVINYHRPEKMRSE